MHTQKDITLDGRKRCARCRSWLSLERFARKPKLSSGYSSWCKECHNAATQEWRSRNREALNARRRAARALGRNA
jgi:hypothetical protein